MQLPETCCKSVMLVDKMIIEFGNIPIEHKRQTFKKCESFSFKSMILSLTEIIRLDHFNTIQFTFVNEERSSSNRSDIYAYCFLPPKLKYNIDLDARKFELHSTNSSETFVIEVNLLEKKNSINSF